jgi:predicted 3-demethylubiquinone-9 3-methyltransferase (glyoxalase superfamily)
MTQKIRPCLWFDGNGQEAAEFYVSVFQNCGDSGITGIAPGPGGKALVVEFRLAGVEFLALNGGPHFKFNEAISLSVDCGSQEELDELWERLSAGGSKVQCGWLKDRYGLSWQIVPAVLPKLLAGADRGRAQRVMAAVMGMTKLDIRALEAAAEAK